MKTMIRKGVFETNSSSSHSLSIDASVLAPELISKDVARRGVIEISTQDFGWEWYRYYGFVHKLTYLFTDILPYTEYGECVGLLTGDTLEDLPEPIQQICHLVKEKTGCDILLTQCAWASVDHDSRGRGLALAQNEDNLKAMLFGANSFIETGNDNSCPPRVIDTDRGTEFYYGKFYKTPTRGGLKLVLKVEHERGRRGFKRVLKQLNRTIPTKNEEMLLKWLSENAVVVHQDWSSYDPGVRSYLIPWSHLDGQEEIVSHVMHTLSSRYAEPLYFSPDLTVKTEIRQFKSEIEQEAITFVYPRRLKAALEEVLSKALRT